jgi:hypothetical protein
MKLELSKREVEVIVETRTWAKAFGGGQRTATLNYFLVLAPLVIIPISVANIFMNSEKTVGAIFLAIGVIMLPFTQKRLKGFRVAKKEVLKEVVAEEQRNKGG